MPRPKSARMSLTHTVSETSKPFTVKLISFPGSYMYVGLAVRTALAMGMNRDPGLNTTKTPSELKAESRTWW